MSNHPKDINEDVIKVIAENSDIICPTVHLPIQSGSTDILCKMNRKYTKEQYLDKVKMIRSYLPDCAITTDIIVGFPGETDFDFNETLDVVEKVKFTGAFTFVYSKRSGTPAATMENQVSNEVKKQRIKKLVEVQNAITRESSKPYLGHDVEILCEDYDKKRNLYLGRDRYNKMGYFKSDEDKIGQFVTIKVEKVNGVSLFGELI